MKDNKLISIIAKNIFYCITYFLANIFLMQQLGVWYAYGDIWTGEKHPVTRILCWFLLLAGITMLIIKMIYEIKDYKNKD